MNRKTIMWIVIGILIAGASIFFRVWQYFKPELIRDFVQSFGIIGPLIYVVLYAGAMFIPMASPVMSVVGGLLFGSILGTIITVITASAVSILPFLTARRIGRKNIEKKLSSSKYNTYLQKANSNGFMFVFYLRLIPVLPYEVQNYVAGLTRVRIGSFVFATFLGILPGTFAFSFLGESLAELSVQRIVIVSAVFLIAIILPLVINKYVKKND